MFTRILVRNFNDAFEMDLNPNRHTTASRKTDKMRPVAPIEVTSGKAELLERYTKDTLKVLQLKGKLFTFCKCTNSDIVLFLGVEQSLQFYACHEHNIKIKY